MKFPQRPSAHIIEDESWKALNSAIPRHWILRDVTKRDYGIDAYLELVAPDGCVTGDLVFLQLKGTQAIDWKQGLHTQSGIRVETINYWLSLPVPVFLCVADTTKREVWFVDVKDRIRLEYERLRTQKTFAFRLQYECTFNTAHGLDWFRRIYERERSHLRFSLDVTTLLANCSRYAEFCNDRYCRDCHLYLEPCDRVYFVHLHRTARTVAMHVGIDWDLESVEELFAADYRSWKARGELHEGTVAGFMDAFAPRLAEIMSAARKHISSTYGDFWKATDPLLFAACCESNEYGRVINNAIQRLNEAG